MKLYKCKIQPIIHWSSEEKQFRRIEKTEIKLVLDYKNNIYRNK